MATSSDVKVKKEPGEDDQEVSHDHRFYIQFEAKDNRPYEINGEDFQTVLQAIKSIEKHPAQEWSVEKLLIQREVGGNKFTIATHFPCCLIKEDETLIISKREDKVEEARENRNVLPKGSYSVFYIDSEGSNNTKTKDLFISTQRQGLKPLCVYGEKGITVQEALKQDGRFQTFGSFSLIDCDDGAVLQSSETIDDFNGKKFQIKLHKEKAANVPEKSKTHAASAKEQKNVDTAVASHGTTAASKMAAQSFNTAVVSALSGLSIMKALKESSSDVDHEEFNKILLEQFSELKKLMESKFTADSFQEKLIMREEKFGKVRQSFSKVHMLEKLIKIGKSVCKVVVGHGCTGTGFVLIYNYILTSAHLFKTYTDGDGLKKGVDVHVIFSYDEPLPGQSRSFKVEDGLICNTEHELDYAVLQVNSQDLKNLGIFQFPSGLLERVGEMPKNGEVCIIGHPEGDVKQIDLTSIIEIEKREQAVKENLSKYTDEVRNLFDDQVKKNGIKKILMGGDRAEKVTTYHTFMYHGASGSPVFDPDGFLCGLHTSGFFYGCPKATESVIEFAYPMKIIITHLVEKLREKKLPDLLERMKAVSGKNDVLKKIFDSIDQPV